MQRRIASGSTTNAQKMIRLPHSELFKEDIVEIGVIVLSSIDDYLFTEASQFFDNQAQTNDFRARA